MRLAEVLKEIQPKAQPFKVDEFLDKVHSDDRAAVLDMLRAPKEKWPHERMAAVLSKMVGESISGRAVSGWRNRQAEK